MRVRGSGILLHITSLPSRYGIGDLGPEAYRFADFLAAARQKYWQILPLAPTDPASGNDPYHGTSAFAGNPLLISPELMAEDGLADPADLADLGGPDGREFSGDCVDFSRVIAFRERILARAYNRFMQREGREDFSRFCRKNAWWLDDYALFAAIRTDRGNESWDRWPEELKRRDPAALAKERERLEDRIGLARFAQFIFAGQWQTLRCYCNERGIRIIGDIPIYVDYDSADVWCHPEFFLLDDDLRPVAVSGVPPDYFSLTGQLWGHPVYRWDVLEKTGFSWWVQRIGQNLSMTDYLRIDHFRGLVAFWQVPAGSATAMDGEWVPAPAERLLSTLAHRFPCLPVIAEDLGIITPDVREVMRRFGIPGMKVLLFGFEDDFPHSQYLPHNADRDCIYYTGTHDNTPVRGWLETEAAPDNLRRVQQYIGQDAPDGDLYRIFVRLAMASAANTVVIPLQDILGLGTAARMNRPGTYEGNWLWRFHAGMLTPEITERLRTLTMVYGRD